MAIRINDANIIDSDGGLVNAPVLTVSNPSSAETLISVETGSSPILGTRAGFTSGGINPSSRVTTIEKFPFSISNGTASDVGDLSQARSAIYTQSSSTDAFATGGSPGGTSGSTFIETFPFSIVTGAAVDTADLTAAKYFGAGHSSSTDGFTAGGLTPPGNPRTSVIEKFPFSISGGTSTDVGNLNPDSGGTGKARMSSQSSPTHAFATGGGQPGGNQVTIIDKYPFTISSGTATDVGDIPLGTNNSAGASSHTNGYSFGGGSTPTNTYQNTIYKFPFAISGGTATDVGDLSTPIIGVGGVSSVVNGYRTGGYTNSSPNRRTTIDKFPFSITGGTATSVGDLTEEKNQIAGHQD